MSVVLDPETEGEKHHSAQQLEILLFYCGATNLPTANNTNLLYHRFSRSEFWAQCTWALCLGLVGRPGWDSHLQALGETLLQDSFSLLAKFSSLWFLAGGQRSPSPFWLVWPPTLLFLPLHLHSSSCHTPNLSEPPPSSTFKDSCDYIKSIWINPNFKGNCAR